MAKKGLISSLIEKLLQIRCVKVALRTITFVLYGNRLVSIIISLILYIFCYFYPLKTGQYYPSIFGFHLNSERLSEALNNKSYLRLLIVALFLAIPPGLEILMDSWKLFSKEIDDKVEIIGSILLILSFIVPNSLLFFSLNYIQTPEEITSHLQYLWVAITRVQYLGIILGMLLQLFGHKRKYADNDKLSFLQFNIEKRSVNISLLFVISAIFLLSSHGDGSWNEINILSLIFNLSATLLTALLVLRMMVSLTLQAIDLRRFRTHHHLSDFMYSLGLLCFILISAMFTLIAARSNFSVESLERYLMSTASTQILILVIVIIIPGVKNRRLAEIKHEQLQTRLNLIRYVSHEMRTPLNTVSMGMNILKGELMEISGFSNSGLEARSRSPGSMNGDVSDAKLGGIFDEDNAIQKAKYIQLFKDMIETVNQVANSCTVAVSTLDDLLTFDKIDEKKLVIEVEELNPWKLLLDTSKPFSINASLKNINFRVILADSPEFLRVECIKGDAFKLAQVIRNLLSNAIKFTPENGTVDVSLKLWESVERGRNVRFSVKDTGAGISKQNMKKLFGQYVQFNAGQLQKGKGSGLGLWITKSIVEMHGGVIGANSEGEGHGTEFYFDVPLKPASKAKSSKIRASLLKVKVPSHVPSSSDRSSVGSVSQQVQNPRGSRPNLAFMEEGLSAIKEVAEGPPSPNKPAASQPTISLVSSTSSRSTWLSTVMGFLNMPKSNKIHIIQEEEGGKGDDPDSTFRRQRESTFKGAVGNFLNYPVKVLNRTISPRDEDEEMSPSKKKYDESSFERHDVESGLLHEEETLRETQKNQARKSDTDLEVQTERYSGNNQIKSPLKAISERSDIGFSPVHPWSQLDENETKDDLILPNLKDKASNMTPETERVTITKPYQHSPISPKKKHDLDSTAVMSIDSRRSTGIGENDLIPDSKKNKLIKTAWEQGLEILLVDDADSNRKMCRRILATNGHKVSEAKDGLDCLKIYEDAKTLGRRFDLILMDDNMPNLLGYETAKKLRERGYEGVLIGVTGDVYPENIHRFVSNGANDVLGKPLNLTKLKEKYVLYTKLLDS